MTFPDSVTDTLLYKRLETNSDYLHSLASIRAVAETLARQTERLLPGFTDHSVRHMDALWSVTSTLLEVTEIARFTVQEIFLLTCTFYVHDLGMAMASTPDGLARLRASEEYASSFKALTCRGVSKERADHNALQNAARKLHASFAPTLAMHPIPGIDRHLIEDAEVRQKWGATVGELAASHHWDLQQIDDRLGRRGKVPTPDGGSADLAFIACVLRLADFAHINRERAVTLERLLRSEINAESSLHWDAQANITGPNRGGNQLIYGCTDSIKSIDAWWLFYDMASGLDAEIRATRDYLAGRTISDARFSLQGVRGIESPEAFSFYVRLDSDVAPIDIRVIPHSMERVINLLGGPALYRDDRLAPVRELIQNCRDAIALRNALETASKHSMTQGHIEVSLDMTSQPPILRVRDNGVGMTAAVVRNHLIAVASNFWDSVEFARDFHQAVTAGFQPIGRFGIGFLSVFMLGNNVEVETERAGSRRVLLKLRGIGRRGELREKVPTGQTGTEIRIELFPKIADRLIQLREVARARAPMLPYALKTEVISKEGSIIDEIEPRWWERATKGEIERFVANWDEIATLGRVLTEEERRKTSDSYHFMRHKPYFEFGYREENVTWPGALPEFTNEIGRIIDNASGSYGVLVCSLGVAVSTMSVDGMTGVIEIGNARMSPDRSTIHERSSLPMMDQMVHGLLPNVRRELDDLGQYGSMPARISLLKILARRYGTSVLAETKLRWIPILEQPGNLIHISPRELRDRVAAAPAVIICTGRAPAGAYSISANRVSPSELSTEIAVLFYSNEFEVTYSVEKRIEKEHGTTIIKMPLDDLIRETADGDSFRRRTPMVLLDTILHCVSEAWNINPQLLRAQDWEMRCDASNSWLWAHVMRPT